MDKKELQPKEKAKYFFYALINFLKEFNKDFIEEEIIREYNGNLENVEALSNLNLNYLKIGEEDIFNLNGNSYVQMKFLPNSDSTKEEHNKQIKKIYKKSNLTLKLYQIILILKEEKI